MVHVTCIMCYTGIERIVHKGILRNLLVRMSSALGSQNTFELKLILAVVKQSQTSDDKGPLGIEL